MICVCSFFDLAVVDSTDIMISERRKPQEDEIQNVMRHSKDISAASKHEDIKYDTSGSGDELSSSSEMDITDNHTDVTDQSDEQKYTSTTSPSSAPTETIKPRTKKEALLAYLQRKAPARIIRRILKCTIAFFISTLFCTIRPVGTALGQAPFIVSAGCLLSHPGRTVGAQIDATITSALGAASAIVYGLAGVSASVAYNNSHPNSHAGAAINCIFLVVGVFVAQTLRQKFPKLFFFSLQFMITILFTMVNSVGLTKNHLNLSSQFGLPFVIGSIVSLLVNLVFWPETAMDGLGRLQVNGKKIRHANTKQEKKGAL